MSDQQEPIDTPSRFSRRNLLIGGGIVAAGVAATGLALTTRPKAGATDRRPVLKIGDQRGNAHALLSGAGVLEDLPYTLEWVELPAAAPLLEALSAGAIDLGGVGAAPFAFAYANGAPIKVALASRIVSLDKDAGRSAAIVVRKDSPFRSLADLRGRRLATIRGSAGHDTALRLLEKAGVDARAVDFVFLNNNDSKAALAAGSIDAWSTWGSYVGIAIEEDGDRVLADAGSLRQVGAISSFLAANAKSLDAKEPQLRDFLARYVRANQWARANPEAFAQSLATSTRVPLSVARYSAATSTAAGFSPIDDEILVQQRRTLTRYLKAGVIDRLPPLDASGYDRRFNDLWPDIARPQGA
ncbi:aliphatic sulfonate ABC transporter substrate-binding protein [Caulobacter hibisci]|uniref:Aliphatic sulfonate ABC transporter substrate-binding protein n=1 Tax=Caulobacter hibisci TaxID=2035993 RepID=A0ABS0STC2_9CAUL|nr:aliphatic sulfonate ABC transporter substrate-binding protein [Caulobacter hibisci]MBI1682879.1 aliphatic sulfonate ABC transporter substrate-binding protein [Caulobacter hibisci]